MIDIETSVIKKVVDILRNRYGSGIYITDEAIINVPARFPTVCIREVSNTTLSRTKDENPENHCSVMYEVDVFSNLETDKKEQAKEIINEVDKVLLSIGFVRSFLEPVPNADTTIYRVKARYTAVVDKQYMIYKN